MKKRTFMVFTMLAVFSRTCLRTNRQPQLVHCEMNHYLAEFLFLCRQFDNSHGAIPKENAYKI